LIRSAFLLGAESVIAIDRFPERLRLAKAGGTETINDEENSTYDSLMEKTGGRGPDSRPAPIKTGPAWCAISSQIFTLSHAFCRLATAPQ
jgi:Zn-dependent alcohol dehydrogenase